MSEYVHTLHISKNQHITIFWLIIIDILRFFGAHFFGCHSRAIFDYGGFYMTF